MKRTGFLEHVGWTGLGLVYTVGATGLVTSRVSAADPFTFVQISDSHIGFHQAPNQNPTATLKLAVDAINALPLQPRFVIHTGDVTHLSKPAQFDEARGVLSTLRAQLFTLPGEHDVIGDDGVKAYMQNFGRGDAPKGWYSFDLGGVHFVAIVNVFNFEKMGLIGTEQLDWIRKDLASQKTSTPIVVFGHVPLYTAYAPWGWLTEDGETVVAMLRRFDNVTVLNGHVHQVLEHTEGKIRFRTALGTAYPQPAPGTAPAPGPLKDVPPDKLLSTLGYRTGTLGDGGNIVLADKMLGA